MAASRTRAIGLGFDAAIRTLYISNMLSEKVSRKYYSIGSSLNGSKQGTRDCLGFEAAVQKEHYL